MTDINYSVIMKKKAKKKQLIFSPENFLFIKRIIY
jgi:hypothetical protein